MGKNPRDAFLMHIALNTMPKVEGFIEASHEFGRQYIDCSLYLPDVDYRQDAEANHPAANNDHAATA